MSAHPMAGEELYRDVIAYTELGEHRTGTEIDRRTAMWLGEQLKAAGLATEFQPFSLRQFFLRDTYLDVFGRRFDCFPLWPPCGTGSAPLRAPLMALEMDASPVSLRGRIALSTGDPASRHERAVSAAAEAGALALVILTDGPSGEVFAFNAPVRGGEPWPLPVLLVARRDGPALLRAAELGERVSLLLDGRDDPAAEARNVVGRLERGRELMVVSTPYSGWFRCAGERGPGVALFLGLARWAARRRSNLSWLFVATSGHELTFHGMRCFLAEMAPPRERVRCWVHLGASIATYGWEETPEGLRRSGVEPRRNMRCVSDLLPLLGDAFAGVEHLEPTVGPTAGELALAMEAGYRSFGFFGRHRFFHTLLDGPETTGPDVLEPVGMALAQALEAIEAG